MMHMVVTRMKWLGLVLLMSVASLAGTAAAGEFKVGSLEIINPWSRATPKAAGVGGGYLTIKNTGTTPDRLLSASLADADHAEIHLMSMDQGVMKMREIKDGLEIKPGETLEFTPQSYHLMFVGLKQPFEQGKTLTGTLTFEKAGTVSIAYDVESIGANAPSHSHHDH